jgi:hypothetical protein
VFFLCDPPPSAFPPSGAIPRSASHPPSPSMSLSHRLLICRPWCALHAPYAALDPVYLCVGATGDLLTAADTVADQPDLAAPACWTERGHSARAAETT